MKDAISGIARRPREYVTEGDRLALRGRLPSEILVTWEDDMIVLDARMGYRGSVVMIRYREEIEGIVDDFFRLHKTMTAKIEELKARADDVLQGRI